MLQSLNLLLPALIPSWRFFQTIDASPRVQWVRLANSTDAPQHWQNYRPRPSHVSAATIAGRLFWNPWWNEALHMVSLAERLLVDPTPYALNAILQKLAADAPLQDQTPFLQFRIQLVSDTAPETAYLSTPVQWDAIRS